MKIFLDIFHHRFAINEDMKWLKNREKQNEKEKRGAKKLES